MKKDFKQYVCSFLKNKKYKFKHNYCEIIFSKIRNFFFCSSSCFGEEKISYYCGVISWCGYINYRRILGIIVAKRAWALGSTIYCKHADLNQESYVLCIISSSQYFSCCKKIFQNYSKYYLAIFLIFVLLFLFINV